MKKARSFFLSAQLPPPRGKFLIGVSGGIDSVALFHFLHARKYRLIVCHLDHGLRRGARADARFVERLAKEDGCQFLGERVAISTRAKKNRQSIETAAREARYEFFARCATRTNCRRIFLAHHADDQVETFLANLFRGAGSSGLAAMRSRSERAIGKTKLTIFRPLLAVWRNEIEAYASAHGLNCRGDESNVSLLHTRNRMRHQIIPLLEKYFGRGIRENIWRTTELLAAEDDFLASLVVKIGAELPVAQLRAQPIALQRRTIRAWLATRKIANFGFREIESIRALLAVPPVAVSTNLSGDRQVRRRAGALFIPRRSARSLA